MRGEGSNSYLSKGNFSTSIGGLSVGSNHTTGCTSRGGYRGRRGVSVEGGGGGVKPHHRVHITRGLQGEKGCVSRRRGGGGQTTPQGAHHEGATGGEGVHQ